MGEPTNDEWWRHDEPAVNDRQARERRAAERRRPEEDPYSGAASHPARRETVAPCVPRRAAARPPSCPTRAAAPGAGARAPRPWGTGEARRSATDTARPSAAAMAPLSPTTACRVAVPGQQRPLGWSQQNVPQLRETSASNGGWKFRPLSPTHGRGIPPVVFLAVGVVLAVALLVIVVRGVSGCVASHAAPAAGEPATSEAAATTEAVATTQAAATDDASLPAHTVLDEGRRTGKRRWPHELLGGG